jgi:hypothetical protein
VLFVLVQRATGGPWRETAELYDLGDEAQILPDLSAAGFGRHGGRAAGRLEVHDTQAVDGLPEYALGAPKGKDAVVIFFTLDTATWTATSAQARMPSASYTGLAEPPLSMLQALGVTSVRAGLRVSIKAVDENLAIVGPAGSGGVTIAANSGRTYTLIRS